MKIHVLLRRDNAANTHGWYPDGAWLDDGEARKAFDAVPAPAILSACKLHGADDLVTLAAKLDEANAKLAEAEKEIARLRALTGAPCDMGAPAVVQYVLGEPHGWLHHNGHCFPLRGAQTEPDEVAHCVRCGVSYAGTGPIMSDPCPGERK